MHNSLDVRLATTLDDLTKVAAVRAIVLVEELARSFGDEFTSNDMTASWILALDGEEPIGTMAIRWFGTYAKFGSLAIRPKFRDLAVSNAIARFAISHVRLKGFTTIYGHALEKVLPFWRRHGLVPDEKLPPMEMTGYQVIPLVGRFEPLGEAIDLYADPALKQLPEASLGDFRPVPRTRLADSRP